MADHPQGRPTDEPFSTKLRSSVIDVVKQQADAGVDIVTDGEFGKLSWNLYITSRLSGIEHVEAERFQVVGKDRRDFAQYYADSEREGVHYFRNPAGKRRTAQPVFTGPIRYIGQVHLQNDIDNLHAALRTIRVEEAFLPSIAPGSVFFENRYFKTRHEFMFAVADALRRR
jgi:5-methyltetrahydropteroyltriglutamate--homocysteine methyltransferase